MAASLGGMGQAIYAAANAHMNSLAANCVAYRSTSPALVWNSVAELCMASRLVAEILVLSISNICPSRQSNSLSTQRFQPHVALSFRSDSFGLQANLNCVQLSTYGNIRLRSIQCSLKAFSWVRVMLRYALQEHIGIWVPSRES